MQILIDFRSIAVDEILIKARHRLRRVTHARSGLKEPAQPDEPFAANGSATKVVEVEHEKPGVCGNDIVGQSAVGKTRIKTDWSEITDGEIDGLLRVRWRRAAQDGREQRGVGQRSLQHETSPNKTGLMAPLQAREVGLQV